MRWGFAAIGSLAPAVFAAAAAHAEPQLEASGFVGVDRFGIHTALGNSWAREQVPDTSPLVGGRLGWLVAPSLPGHLQLAVEAEFAFAAASTGDSVLDGRMTYFAPVYEWRAHALLRLPRERLMSPHLLVGAGGDTIASSSPFMAKETEPVVYWGLGVSVPVSTAWRLRIDLRHGIMAARDGGLTSALELQLGLGTSFGAAAAPAVAHVVVVPPPPEPERVPEVAPEPDTDGDGIIDRLDQCPNEPEDKDGFQDADGCPDLDNDNDDIPDPRDACPLVPETRNGFEDDDGCPDELPADVTAALATPIKFEARRARVTRPAGTALRPLIAMLEAHPSIRLSIIGHAERAGAPGDDLAKRRADAIKWYLVDQGVIEDRLATSVGAALKLRDKAPPVSFELIVKPPATAAAPAAPPTPAPTPAKPPAPTPAKPPMAPATSPAASPAAKPTTPPPAKPAAAATPAIKP
ncbi:MAG TPA: OmpA family protein [Kofleriaceae bacterium]|nr:OmpA family protein [Kofleriaceae bacterium]